MRSPFDYVNEILLGKNQIIVDAESEKEYQPFIVNKSLSYHKDCVMEANEMNLRHTLDKRLQNDFLLNTVRSYRRPFNKWAKVEINPDIEKISLYFGFSKAKAKDALRVLSEDQIKTIREKTNIGGLKKS